MDQGFLNCQTKMFALYLVVCVCVCVCYVVVTVCIDVRLQS